MHTSYYLLITIAVLDGFFMRPLHQFVLGKGIKLVKYVNRKSLAIVLLITSMLSGMAVTLSTIYLSLKLAGFVPLGKEYLGFFIVSFIVGGALWIFYARHFNRACPIDLDQELNKWG